MPKTKRPIKIKKQQEEQKTDPLEIMRHSTAHVMAAAIKQLFPEAKFGIGPTIEYGFYYDFDLPRNLVPEDLVEIEKIMKEIVKKDLPFRRKEMTIKEALKTVRKLKQPYKEELIRDLEKQGEKKVSFYETGQVFLDLCRGPHINSTKEVGAFKLTKIAGAYWRGDEKNKMLQRIYGVAFNTEEELNNYLNLLAEAEKRDHRVLGEKLEIFTINELVGKGLPLWLPKGAIVRQELEKYMQEKEKKYGYEYVYTPHICRGKLYEMSGHLAHYKDDMYAPIVIEDEDYYLKPMNCPHHHMIYKSKTRSYRNLPLRLAEFGTVYRFERSGVLTGLIRVRGFTQNDAHIYCTEEQLQNEIKNVIKLFNEVYQDFPVFRDHYYFRLSLPDFENKEKYGDIENRKLWEHSAGALRQAMKDLKIDYLEAVGEAAFYGPKIDIQIKNVYGKEDTLVTIQVDFYMPSRFDLKYTDRGGEEKRPIVIHRAILGAFERFMAFLLEYSAGNLPLWLSPVQVIILPVGSRHIEYSQKLGEEFRKEGLRIEIDDANETIGNKIRKAEGQKIPYMLVIGDKERESGDLAVRARGVKDIVKMKVGEFVERVKEEVRSRKYEL